LSSVNGSAGEEDPTAGKRIPRRDRRRRSRRWWPFVLLGLGLIVALSLVVPFGRHQWAESLIRQPSAYTSVAFANPTGLPTAVVSGQALTFTFTVGNHEPRSLVYAFFLKSSPSNVIGFGGSFGGGSVAVPAGRSRSVTVSVDPKCAGSPCRISVLLLGYPVTVDFNVRVAGLGATAGKS
jgi:hypothetical protein